MFRNRIEAAKLLVRILDAYKGKNPLVLGIPRGAVPMAKVIADGLAGELNAILVPKIPAPGNEEFAIGSIGLSGHVQKMPYTDSFVIGEDYLKEEPKRQLALLKARQKRYGLKEPCYLDRLVIIVEDGIATRSTVLSAIYEVKLQHPKKVVVAAAVAARETAEKICEEADELITLEELTFFMAVGQFFENFDQVTYEEVIALFKMPS